MNAPRLLPVCDEEWMGIKCALPEGHAGPHVDRSHRYTKNVCPHGVVLSEYGPMTAAQSFCGICAGLLPDRCAGVPAADAQRGPQGER